MTSQPLAAKQHYSEARICWKLKPGYMEISGYKIFSRPTQWYLHFGGTETIITTFIPERSPDGMLNFRITQEKQDLLATQWRIFYSRYFLDATRTLEEIWRTIYATPGLSELSVAHGYTERHLMSELLHA